MTRVFGRHELKQAILEALAETGPANGYLLMQALSDRIGGGWKPSPGAIYPALLALEDGGFVVGTDDGAGRVYELAATGRADAARHEGTLDRVAQRARGKQPLATVASLLDRFAANHPSRRATLDADGERQVAAILATAADEIEAITTTHRGTK